MGNKVTLSKKISILSFLFGLAAFFLLSAGSIGMCDYIKFTSSDESITADFAIASYKIYNADVSIDESYSAFNSCREYPLNFLHDPGWRVSYWFRFVLFFLGFVVLIGHLLMMSSSYAGMSLDCQATGYFLVAFFQGLILLLFLNSNACHDNVLVDEFGEDRGVDFPDACSLSAGARYHIAATVLWAVAGLVSWAGYRFYLIKEERQICPLPVPDE